MRRETTVVPAVYLAECQDCGWMSGWSRNALGLAAQHHDRTGHLVRCGVERAIYYGRFPAVTSAMSTEMLVDHLTFAIEA